MKLKKLRDDIAAFAVVLAIGVYFLLFGIKDQVGVPAAAANSSFTPRTFPVILFAVITACAAVGLVKSIVLYTREKRQEQETPAPGWHDKSRKGKIAVFMPWICLLLCFCYAVIFSKFGFIAATLIIPPAILLVLGCRKWQHYLYVYAFCGVMYLIFTLVLKVHLP